MKSLVMLQALWRPVSGVVMALVVLAVALGWLPEGAEAHAESILTTAGTVLLGLTASRAVQRVQEAKAGNPAQVADEVVARLRDVIESSKAPKP